MELVGAASIGWLGDENWTKSPELAAQPASGVVVTRI
jgi:hypothetical protein